MIPHLHEEVVQDFVLLHNVEEFIIALRVNNNVEDKLLSVEDKVEDKLLNVEEESRTFPSPFT